MSRIVSVWLPRWPILRSLAAQRKNPSAKPVEKPVDPAAPFVLVTAAAGGPRIVALNEPAEALGLAIGEPLADARAKAGFLQVRDHDIAADDVALRRLALWATRYTPTASPWDDGNGADGFFLDIEGAAHLFGGEEKLLADLGARLHNNFGLPARLAVAATPGAAWALSRFHPAPSFILPSGREAEALAPLPIEALRLSPDTRAALRRLGFKIIGSLLDKPRAPFAARFPAEFLRRIDQALGRSEEPLIPVVAPPVYHCLHYLAEPIITQEAVVARTRRLMQTLLHVLERDDVGARTLKLSLYRVDGAVEIIDIALTLPTRSVVHVIRLLDLKLEALSAMEDAGFGFEAVGLAVTRAEPMPAQQTDFVSTAAGGEESGWGGADRIERCATLIDTLCQRLGADSVRRIQAVASHIPERAEFLAPPDADFMTAHARDSADSNNFHHPTLDSRLCGNEQEKTEGDEIACSTSEQKPRPLLLLPRAEQAEVTALVPDGPPRRFCWRGVTYDITGSQGPERIASEWWRPSPLADHSRERQNAATRDYYVVEDNDGHRFWLYREGLYGRETNAARWFVHGLFA
jgi:protein ImuB